MTRQSRDNFWTTNNHPPGVPPSLSAAYWLVALMHTSVREGNQDVLTNPISVLLLNLHHQIVDILFDLVDDLGVGYSILYHQSHTQSCRTVWNIGVVTAAHSWKGDMFSTSWK